MRFLAATNCGCSPNESEDRSFFLAVLPQFLGSADNPGLQMGILGAVDLLMEVILYGCIGVLAGAFHTRLTGSTNATTALNYLACAVYFVLAATIITEVFTDKPFPTASVNGRAEISSSTANHVPACSTTRHHSGLSVWRPTGPPVH